MLIRNITKQEWEYFHHHYPYDEVNDASNFHFEETCIDHCSVDSDMEVIGAFIHNTLVGMLSYQSVHFSEKQEHTELSFPHPYPYYLDSEPQENSIPILYACSLIVHPHFRKKGVGTALLTTLKSKKINEQYIMMYPANTASKSLAQTLGFFSHETIWTVPEEIIAEI